jgi:NAD(P)-dependent dehydrogenase (short-subunit alcohol dehydrogenase family)
MKQADLFDVRGHVAVVTGAASGLGLAYVEVLAENGATVIMVDLNNVELTKHAARLAAAGYAVEPATLDVADIDALRAAIDDAARRHGRLDILFANAGISAGPGTLMTDAGAIDRFDPSLFRRALDVNLTATVMAMRFAVPHMKARASGSIVATASIAGIRSEPMVGYGYIASKAAVINVVRQAAVELAPWNIRVNAIAPGPFVTNIGGGRLHREPDVVKLFADMVPMGRLANTDEIKGLALLLASPAGSYLTGTIIPIDGGTTAVMTRGKYSTAAARDA